MSRLGRTFWSAILAFGLLTRAARSQDVQPEQPGPEPARVVVTVVDSITRRGIGNAMVVVTEEAKHLLSKSGKTEPNGTLTVMVSRNRPQNLYAQAVGYVPANRQALPQNEENKFTIELAPLGFLQGTLVDEENTSPLENVRVSARRVRFARGKRQVLGVLRSTTTDKAGHFALDKLWPGDYIIETGIAGIDTRAGVTKGYPRRFWPGGGAAQDAPPVHLLPGAHENLGAFKMRKAQLYSATVAVNGPLCDSRDHYTVELVETNSIQRWSVAETNARCNSPAHFEALGAGTLEVRVTTAAYPSDKAGVGTLSITDTDVNLRVDVRRPTTVAGRIRTGDLPPGSNADSFPDGTKIKLWPSTGEGHQSDSRLPIFTSATVAPDGTFEGPVYVPANRKVQVQPFGLPAGYCVQSVKTNTARFNGNEIELYPGQESEEIEVLLGRAAIISGEVADCTCFARVFAIPEHAAHVDGYPLTLFQTPAPSGTFKFDRLPPGKYNIVAVEEPGEDDDRLEQPDRLISLAASGKSAEVSPASQTTVRVPLSHY